MGCYTDIYKTPLINKGFLSMGMYSSALRFTSLTYLQGVLYWKFAVFGFYKERIYALLSVFKLRL